MIYGIKKGGASRLRLMSTQHCGQFLTRFLFFSSVEMVEFLYAVLLDLKKLRYEKLVAIQYRSVDHVGYEALVPNKSYLIIDWKYTGRDERDRRLEPPYRISDKSISQ